MRYTATTDFFPFSTVASTQYSVDLEATGSDSLNRNNADLAKANKSLASKLKVNCCCYFFSLVLSVHFFWNGQNSTEVRLVHALDTTELISTSNQVGSLGSLTVFSLAFLAKHAQRRKGSLSLLIVLSVTYWRKAHSQAAHSGDWLFTMSIFSCGLHPDNCTKCVIVYCESHSHRITGFSRVTNSRFSVNQCSSQWLPVCPRLPPAFAMADLCDRGPEPISQRFLDFKEGWQVAGPENEQAMNASATSLAQAVARYSLI